MSLKAVPHRLSKLDNRLGFGNDNPDTERRRRDPARKLYSTSKWRELRHAVLVRDKYICQQTGEILSGKPPAANSPVVHHKIAHKGDKELFFDIGNLELVSKAWHDSVAQSEEKRFL